MKPVDAGLIQLGHQLRPGLCRAVTVADVIVGIDDE